MQYWTENIAGKNFESAILKNRCISKTEEPILIFANQDVTTGEELVQMLTDYPYMERTDLLVLCKKVPETTDWYGILSDLEMEVYALIVRREVFARCSSFNFRLSDDTNREFLCRASEVCEPLFLECSEVNWERTLTSGVFQTNAYLLVRYLSQLRIMNCMNLVLEKFIFFAESHGYRHMFEQSLNQMLAADRSLYNRIYLATAPFFIIRGSSICYGVLQTFADQLTNALRRQGQRVIETESGEISEEQIRLLGTELFRGIIGFQATISFQSVFNFVKGNRFNFWFDHPMFFHGLFSQMEIPGTFLCQDGDHACYINQYFSKAKGIQFPPGGNPSIKTFDEKKYDISFMGTFFDEQKMWDVVDGQEGIMRELSRDCAEFLLVHVHASYNDLKEMILEKYSEIFEQYSFEVVANCIWEATRIAPYRYRKKAVQKILEAGFELHVYGESWRDYPIKAGERLVIHEQIEPEMLSEEMSKSRISLNVMSWHKAGMTERIIEIMMAGSVCLTDETTYLKNHFSQMENIVMFQLDRLDELPDLIAQILNDRKLQQEITGNAYRKVLEEHTWDVRAREFLQLVTEMEEICQ